MAKTQAVTVRWRNQPDEHDYPAAQSYLSLVLEPDTATEVTARLRDAAVTAFKAKDIFRASGLSLLGVSNSHVETDRRKIAAGEKLSPILLLRDPVGVRVVIADGYHRLCAVYSYDEDAVVPCKIVSLHA